MQYGYLRQRFGAPGNGDIGVTECNLVGGIGNGLICRRARTSNRVRLQCARKVWQQGHFPRDVGRDDRWQHRSVHQQVNEAPVEIRALHQLSHGALAEVDRGVVLEQRA